GPDSWSAADVPDADLDGVHEEAMTSGPLIWVRRSDVPRVVGGDDSTIEPALDHRAGFILSLIDGCSSVETVLDVAGLPEEESLAALCDLCARGIVTLAA